MNRRIKAKIRLPTGDCGSVRGVNFDEMVESRIPVRRWVVTRAPHLAFGYEKK